MDWYYVDNGRRIGPVDDATLQVLVNAGAVGPGTLVWRDGMPDWQPYAAARQETTGAPGAAAPALAFAPVMGGFRAALASPFAENENPLLLLAQFAAAAAYSTLFVGRYGATPGKMAAGLQVVTPDGGQVGYGTALGRYFAEILSSVILGIGYLMIAFDAQKRGLHDRICRTRVVFR